MNVVDSLTSRSSNHINNVLRNKQVSLFLCGNLCSPHPSQNVWLGTSIPLKVNYSLCLMDLKYDQAFIKSLKLYSIYSILIGLFKYLESIILE